MAFTDLEQSLLQVKTIIDKEERAFEKLGSLAQDFGNLNGTNEVAGFLYSAQRALRPGKVNRDKAVEDFESAVKAYYDERAWRNASSKNFVSVLSKYVGKMSATISAQHQDKLTKDQALSLASCSARHRDISLYF